MKKILKLSEFNEKHSSNALKNNELKLINGQIAIDTQDFCSSYTDTLDSWNCSDKHITRSYDGEVFYDQVLSTE